MIPIIILLLLVGTVVGIKISLLIQAGIFIASIAIFSYYERKLELEALFLLLAMLALWAGIALGDAYYYFNFYDYSTHTSFTDCVNWLFKP